MKDLVILILVILALFLCLMPRDYQINILNKIGIQYIPPHICLILLGGIFFTMATILAQQDYIEKLVECVKASNQIAGAVIKRAYVISDKAIRKMPPLEKVADKIEHFVYTVDINI